MAVWGSTWDVTVVKGRLGCDVGVGVFMWMKMGVWFFDFGFLIFCFGIWRRNGGVVLTRVYEGYRWGLMIGWGVVGLRPRYGDGFFHVVIVVWSGVVMGKLVLNYYCCG